MGAGRSREDHPMEAFPGRTKHPEGYLTGVTKPSNPGIDVL